MQLFGNACVCYSDVVSYPDPQTAAADGLHHRYAERGSAYFFVTSGRSRRWIFNGTIKLQACGDLHF